MRCCTTHSFEEEPYNITGRGGGGGYSLSSSSYSSTIFVIVLIIIFVINFIIRALDNRHVKIGLNSRNGALHVTIEGVDAYVYQHSGHAPGQSRSLEQGRSGTVVEYLRRQQEKGP